MSERKWGGCVLVLRTCAHMHLTDIKCVTILHLEIQWNPSEDKVVGTIKITSSYHKLVLKEKKIQ